MTIWIAAVLIVLAVAMFIAAPLAEGLFDRQRESGDIELRQLEHQRSLAVQGLRELDFDYEMGKLRHDDYRDLRHTLEGRALAAMSALESERKQVSSLSRPAADPSSHVRSASFCPNCGAHSGTTQNFCTICGATLAEGIALNPTE